jgi:hypothetical protein
MTAHLFTPALDSRQWYERLKRRAVIRDLASSEIDEAPDKRAKRILERELRHVD